MPRRAISPRQAADGELDIAFVDGPIDQSRLTKTDLGHDALVLAMRRDDPLAERGNIRLSDGVLQQRDFVEYRADSALRAQVDTACARAGLSRHVACETGNMQYLVELIQQGAGLSALPPMAIRGVAEDVIGIPITPAIRRDLSAVVAAGRPPVAAAEALLDLLGTGMGAS